MNFYYMNNNPLIRNKEYRQYKTVSMHLQTERKNIFYIFSTLFFPIIDYLSTTSFLNSLFATEVL